MTEPAVDPDRAALLAELLAAVRVRPTGTDAFEATSPDWWGERVFGGMVVAQHLSAAQHGTAPGLRLHSAHGSFLRAVVPGPPVTLRVEHLREGRTFTTRQVTAEQAGRATSRFVCSFHTEEPGDEYQLPMQDVPHPDGLPSSDAPGPFLTRDAGPLPCADGTFRSSARLWHRTVGPLPDDPAAHVAMLGFFSDMTRTSFRPLSLDDWGTHIDASVDHAVWFHRPARPDRWLFYDLQAVVNTAGRSLVRGLMYTEDGRLVLSMSQELLIRRLPGAGGNAPWRAGPADSEV
ncbi:MAG TPA: acyl-CoA thioesterase domain-containing protein [Acidimicrobiales bacterium]|nr:acyl-CoA thioesterase domain-containing protein [Acidimicrobiales bacterium]